MTTTNTVSPYNTAETLTSTNTTQRDPSTSLGKDDFLKLLVGQMKNMDPLGAGSSDPSAMMAQMTQFSMLEQLTNLNSQTKALADQTTVASTLALIGRTVSYPGSDGSPIEGVVEQVTTAGGTLTLTVDGKAGIDPGDVLEVR